MAVLTLPSKNPAVEAAMRLALEQLCPPEELDYSEWALKYRRLSSESSAEVGRLTFTRYAYQPGILDACNEVGIFQIVMMTSAQVGKTEILNSIAGYHMHHDPAPILAVFPNGNLARSWSLDRLEPMIRDSPELTERVAESKSRTTGNTIGYKRFRGGHITIVTANVPGNLAMRPIRILLMDEIDRFPASAGKEGDPVDLAQRRTVTFKSNRLIVLTSTPTIKGLSRIEKAWLRSDQRRFMVPCPICEYETWLKWPRVQWEKAGDAHLPHTASYHCEQCDESWTDVQRWRAIRRGHWEATAPQIYDTAGFHLSELYSPHTTLEELAKAWIKSEKDEEMRKVFYNTRLGESYEDLGDHVEIESLMQRRETYDAPVPAGVVLLVCGVDIQDDRAELEVIGYGADEESWSIDYQVIWGNPATKTFWADLDKALQRPYAHQFGHELRPICTAIDSGGHFTRQVYEFTQDKSHRRVYAIKGVGGEGRPIVWAPRVKKTARQKGVALFMVGVDEGKALLYSRLRIKEPGPGYCHFPNMSQYDEEHFKGLTAEKRVTRLVRGYPKREWHKQPGIANEPLDCRNYGYAALLLLNPVWEVLLKTHEGLEEDYLADPKRRANRANSPPSASPVRQQRTRRKGGRGAGGWVKKF